jgi:5-methylcytosine-specific restriction enzyme A
MNRREFIESQGATCKNWQYDWSFINQSKKLIIFGAFDHNLDGKDVVILSEDWKVNRRGHKSKGYNHSLEHIRLIEKEGYRLMTFPMKSAERANGTVKITGITPKLTEKKLEKRGRDWYAIDLDAANPVRLAEELSNPERYSEGARTLVTINAYERNPKARAACVAHHGYICVVCKFDFANIYGNIGEKFIHVHHVVPIGKIGKEYEIDPIKDLIPVCPNCHAMIHRVEPPLPVEQLRKHISELKKS